MFGKKDFDNLQFNPLAEGDLLGEYPALAQIVTPEMAQTADIDKLLRYVIMLHEPKSILVLQERDLNYRKGVAADLAQLNENETYRESIYTYSDEIVFKLATEYLKIFSKSKEFAAILVLENSYWESLKLLLKPIDTSGKDKDILDAVQKKSTIKVVKDQS